MCPAPSPLTGWRGVFALRPLASTRRRCTLQSVADDVWEQARHALRQRHEACLTAIANHYGHPVEASSVEVRAAVSAAIRAAFDLGVEFAHRRSTIPPPPPSDAEVVLAAEGQIRELRRS